MTKFNLEKCKSGNKGITLIALIITIIVLLILAGITINALTGSDSAPAKANEAEQKNDIGSAKDQIAVSAINAKTTAYETAYVGNSVSAGNAATTIGQAVIDAVLPFNGTSTGKASIEVTQAETNSVKGDATITITTRDFEVEGTITIQDGILTWGEIVPNVPGVFLDKTSETLNPGGTLTLIARKKNVSENITWTITGDSTITKTEDSGDNLKVTINVASGASNGDNAIIKASAGGYEATCKITVEKVPVQKVSFNNAPTEIQKGERVTLTITTTDNNNKPATPTSVTFSSTDTTVATIGATSGELEGKKAGTTTISVTASDGTNSANASFSLTVNPSIADSINAKIGTVISYATKATATTSGYSANYTGDWKIFYANSEEMFIIPSSIIDPSVVGFNSAGIPVSGTNSSTISGVTGTGTYCTKYNSSWLTTSGATTGQNRHNATAYLCDTSKWDGFVVKTAGSTPTKLIADSYAVGGPTYELFIDAWNVAKPDTKSKSKDAYGYNWTLGSANSLGGAAGGTVVANGVFRPSSSGSYWLASPSYESSYSNGVLIVNCYHGIVGHVGYDYTNTGVRPLVSIPMSNVQVEESGNVSILTDAQLQH